jgi:hypothetical protein
MPLCRNSLQLTIQKCNNNHLIIAIDLRMVDCSSLRQQVQRDTIIIFVKSHHLLKYGLPILVDSYVQSTDYHKQHHYLRLQTMMYFTNLTYFIAYKFSLLLNHYLTFQCRTTTLFAYSDCCLKKQPSPYYL